MLDTIHGRLFKVSRFAVIVGGAALLISAILVTLDVLSRGLFNYSVSGSDEITGYVFAASTTWAYSYCLLSRANIRIDALYNTLSMKPRAILDTLGLLALAYYIFLLSASALDVLVESIEFEKTAQTTLATPLWIPQVFWASGLFFFLFCLCFLSFYVLFKIAKGDWHGVNKLAGMKSIEEEVAEERHA